MGKSKSIAAVCLLTFAITTLGCAMAITDKYLTDKGTKADHTDDQYVSPTASEDNNFSKDR